MRDGGVIPVAAYCSDPCDGRTQGTTGMFDSLPYRNDAAIIMRRLIRSLPGRLGVIGVATCDKGLPATMMALAGSKDLPGILVPDEVIDRMTKAGAKWAGKKAADLSSEEKKARSKAWQAEGIQVCIDLIKDMQKIEGVAGVHIMAIEWEEAVKPIVEGAGLYPRPEFN